MTPHDDITPKILLDHIQAMRQEFAGRFDVIEGKLNKMNGRLGKLEEDMEDLKTDMTFVKAGIQNIDQRLDEIEMKRLPALERS
jgi:tetrahydromethanopterin S-methyltransferase subunit G